ncbi:MAG: hypothetical protein MUC92_07665 [Fimbriimonadaceae bacterium]|jgi:hypothetical protein|nr:hypothetical protein [Fimbriimonadaceae bacterium]
MMILNSLSCKTVAWAFLLMTPSFAFAQLVELDSTREGTGRLDFRTSTSGESVRQVRVRLNRNGEAEIIITRGTRETLWGYWRDRDSRRVTIELRRMGRDDVVGDATIELDGRGSFTRVSAEGRLRNNSAEFSLSFDTGRGQGGNGNQFGSFNSNRDGEGTLSFQTRSSTQRLRRLQVNLRQSGDFEIASPDRAFDRISGRWRAQRGNTIQLEIERIGNEWADGSGTVKGDGRGSFDRVTLSASTDSVRFNLDFRSFVGWVRPGNDKTYERLTQEERRYADRARRAVEDRFDPRTRFEFIEWEVAREQFGNRVVRGKVEAIGGNRPGRYIFQIVLGANTLDVKSARVDADRSGR